MLSHPPGDAQAGAFAQPLVQKYMTLLPQQPHGPWTPGGNLKLAAAGNKLSFLDDHLAAPAGSKEQYLTMEWELCTLAFVLVLLRTVGLCHGLGEEMGLRQGVLHSPRSRSI